MAAQSGLHHVTIFAGQGARNLDFYTRVLGLRLVKTTVNFDDPETHHLYYGDETGRPGTIITFFPIERAPAGVLGRGETSETAFLVPIRSLGFWASRLSAAGAQTERPAETFDEPLIRFKDPDGTKLALVGTSRDEGGTPWAGGDVPAEHAIRGLHGVTLLLDDTAGTEAVLTDVLGFTVAGREGTTVRLRGSAPIGGHVTLHAEPGTRRGRQGAGSVHHVAFRAADDAMQAMMADRLLHTHGLRATEQRDRAYFRSIYFREPGGVLFEIATDAPGFAIDEAPAHLGHVLKLPSFLEPRREAIEAALPPLRPNGTRGVS